MEMNVKSGSFVPTILQRGLSSDSFLVVNGIRDAQLTVNIGELYRLRVVHAGVDGWLNLKMEQDSQDQCELWIIARDGRYLKHPRLLKTYCLVPPGSRVDFIGRCSSVVAGNSFPRLVSRNQRLSVNGILGPNSMVWNNTLFKFKIISPSSNIVANAADLSTLTFRDHPKNLLFAKERIQRFRFVWTQGKGKDKSGYTFYGINGHLYPISQRPVVNVELDKIQEWVIDSGGYHVPESHPFHLHTNAFQITQMNVPGCSSVIKKKECSELDYQIGDWRDTITVPYQGSVTIRWRPRDFTGMSLAHCHILAHEDEGMMLAFRIVSS